MAAHTGFVLECNEGIVVGRTASAMINLSVNGSDRAEECQGLIDEVRAEVEEEPATKRWGRLLSPRT